jgi:hypothetical protein
MIPVAEDFFALRRMRRGPGVGIFNVSGTTLDTAAANAIPALARCTRTSLTRLHLDGFGDYLILTPTRKTGATRVFPRTLPRYDALLRYR